MAAASADGAAPPKPDPPLPQNPQEESIDLEWAAVAGATGYIVLVRLFPEPFESAKEHFVLGDACKTTVSPLRPTSTYGFRLVAVRGTARSEPSEECMMDTQAADCTPKERKCAVM
ncbi:hypothetical protein FNF27_07750 [Cafeteria roenbergensis]|uniref:Fibronectin type-III domain-containing protein n=2 Tax=Cafeteria roenbergensis TaxID=33653 RepID=A0A5A8CGD7_CAFRO|nr:hypothetical protein FNF28_07755 [Cafeteria roenbergensis]KAA0147718.1 hypothetical protein FNF29_07172 [Cafeteria roenbergensis]KAA0152123.1 hypothetical protein FNF31_06697 [Cafeteria roenbergensis]KAA0164822.1 hypothetical protein FNF27_07750 [Cafeteria roenbergensis]|eukprot:KAA0147718.1 hypothetical protein FNF29_07172 [Cafeteria roenbergensis]